MNHYQSNFETKMHPKEWVMQMWRHHNKIQKAKGNFDGILRFVVPDIEIFDKSIEFVLDCGGSKPFTLIVYRFVLLKAGNYDEKI